MSKKNVENKLTVKVETRGMKETSGLLESINKQLTTTQTRGLKIAELINSTNEALSNVSIVKAIGFVSATKEIKEAFKVLGKIPTEITQTYSKNIDVLDKSTKTALNSAQMTLEDIKKSGDNFKLITENATNAINSQKGRIDDKTVDKVSRVSSTTSSLTNSTKTLSKFTEETLDIASKNLTDALRGFIQVIDNLSQEVHKESTDLVGKVSRAVSAVRTSTESFSTMTSDITDNAKNNFSRSLTNFIDVINDSAGKVNRDALKDVNDVKTSSNGIKNTIKRLSELTDDELNKSTTNLDKGLTGLTDTLNKYDGTLKESAYNTSINSTKAAGGVAKTIEKLSGLENIDTGLSNFEKTLVGITGTLDKYKDSVSKETLEKSKDIGSLIGRYATNTDKMSKVNIDDAVNKFNKFVIDAVDTLQIFNYVSEDGVKAMSSLGSSVTSTANGLTKLSQLTEEQYQLGVKRAIDASNQRAQAAYETNKQIHAQSVKDNRHWFDNLFDKSKSKKDRFKESGGLLLGDVKNTMVNGLKGLITGGIFNLAIKGITSLIKLALTPLKTIFKLGTSFAKTMLRTATSTETFKKLMELVVMPFTLLFTLMFAPILVKLAPLLVDMVQKVTEKWDVLEGIGNKIAEVLTLFFDDNNWFSFGNVLDWIIETLDELATIAYNTFQQCKEAGDTGLGALVAVAANLIIKLTDKIIEFVMSPDGLYLFWAVGEIVGLLLVEALKIVIVAIGPTIVSVLGILGGIIATCFIEIIRGVARVIEQTITAFGIGSLFAGMINDVADEMDSKFTGDNLKSNLESKLTEQGLYGSNTSTINNINYQTTNFNQYKGSLYATSGKQLSMGGW